MRGLRRARAFVESCGEHASSVLDRLRRRHFERHGGIHYRVILPRHAHALAEVTIGLVVQFAHAERITEPGKRRVVQVPETGHLVSDLDPVHVGYHTS